MRDEIIVHGHLTLDFFILHGNCMAFYLATRNVGQCPT